MEPEGAAPLRGRWNSGIFDNAAAPCRRAFCASGTGNRICTRLRRTCRKSAGSTDGSDSGLRRPANADAVHIRTVFCTRIQGNQGTPCVHRAGAQPGVNTDKKFFYSNLYEFCIFCEGFLILLKNKL